MIAETSLLSQSNLSSSNHSTVTASHILRLVTTIPKDAMKIVPDNPTLMIVEVATTTRLAGVTTDPTIALQ